MLKKKIKKKNYIKHPIRAYSKKNSFTWIYDFIRHTERTGNVPKNVFRAPLAIIGNEKIIKRIANNTEQLMAFHYGVIGLKEKSLIPERGDSIQWLEYQQSIHGSGLSDFVIFRNGQEEYYSNKLILTEKDDLRITIRINRDFHENIDKTIPNWFKQKNIFKHVYKPK